MGLTCHWCHRCVQKWRARRRGLGWPGPMRGRLGSSDAQSGAQGELVPAVPLLPTVASNLRGLWLGPTSSDQRPRCSLD